jgi:hypothetical protein
MSYPEDPNMARRPNPQDPFAETETSYTGWVLAGIATLVVLFGLMFMFGRNDGTTETASTSPNRPQVGTTGSATSPPQSPATTGAGSASPPPAPANR